MSVSSITVQPRSCRCGVGQGVPRFCARSAAKELWVRCAIKRCAEEDSPCCSGVAGKCGAARDERI